MNKNSTGWLYNAIALALITLTGACAELEHTAASDSDGSNGVADPVPDAAVDPPPANVLIWPDPDVVELANTLEATGRNVIIATTLPEDLSAYQVIWHVGAVEAVTDSEQARLAEFLAAGGGLHMTGERPCCEPVTSSWTTFVNSVVADGGVTVGGQGEVFAITGHYGYPYAANPDAIAGITVTPATVAELTLPAAGGIGGLGDDANILAWGRSQQTDEVIPVAAAWDSDQLVTGAGRLTLVMDCDWLRMLSQADDAALAENLQHFLEGAQPARN